MGPKMQKNKSKLTPLKLAIGVKGWVIYVRNGSKIIELEICKIID